MTPSTQRYFDALLERLPPPGSDVLEIGANAASARGMQRALPDCRYTGIDLAPSAEARAHGVVDGNANEMPFDDASFDAVISNSMFEHDRRFWVTLAEVRRVLRTGGRFYVGVPGYQPRLSRVARWARRARDWLAVSTLRDSQALNGLIATRTYPYHGAPDYFRFSRDAVRHVLLDGFDVLSLDHLYTPPRIIAVGQLGDA